MSVPSRWERSTLGQLGQYLNGRGFKKAEWSTSGRPIIRIQNLTGSSSEFNYFDGEADARHTAHSGDLLVSWAATLGAYFWNGPEAVVNQHIFKVESFIEPKFHKYLLDYKLEELKHETHGSGMAHITRPKFDALPVAIPGRDEQRRIVELVEEHLSHLDAADASMDQAKYRVSGLIDNVLTTWRERNTTAMTPLGAIALTQLGKMLDAKKAAGQPVPYLANINVRWGEFDLRDLRTVLLTDPEREKFSLQPGDLLLCEGGEPGRGAVWKGEVPNIAFQKALHRVRVSSPDRWRPEFVAAMIREGIRRHRWDHLFTGTTIKHLPQEKLRILEIPDASSEQQDLLLDRVRSLEDHVVRLQESVAVNQQRSAALRRAVLAAAFSGRLTGSSSDTSVIEEAAAGLAPHGSGELP